MTGTNETLYNIELNKYQIEILKDSISYSIKNNKDLTPKLKLLLLSVLGEIANKTENENGV
jgi:hypothetical protein